MQLLQGKYQAYADLSTKTVAPLLFARIKPEDKKKLELSLEPTGLLHLIAVLGLVPLIDPDLLQKLPEHQVRSLASDWQGFLAKAPTDLPRQEVDQVVNALLCRLGSSKQDDGKIQPISPTDKTGWEALRKIENNHRSMVDDIRKGIQTTDQAAQVSFGRR
jgi:hypothetical protein